MLARLLPPLMMLGCGPEVTTFSGPEPTLPPQVEAWELILDPLLPLVLVAEVHVKPAAPTTLVAMADDGTVHELHSVTAADHRFVFLGLTADTVYDLQVITHNDAGDNRVTGEVTLPALPDDLPRVRVHTASDDRTEGAYLMPLTLDDRQSTWIAVVNATGDFQWLYDTSGAPVHEVLPTATGVRAIAGANVLEIDWDGSLRTVFRAPDLTGDDGARFHDDVHLGDDGRLVALVETEALADDIPRSYTDVRPLGEVPIAFDEVLTFAPDGSDPQRWPLTSLLDTSRIGWDSLRIDPDTDRMDWGHAASVDLDAAADAWIVPMRHQDAVIAVDRSSGQLQWILANPAQWSEALDAQRLQPVGEVSWPYHPHGAQMVSDDELILFDSGNRRTTPFAGEPETDQDSWVSRVVSYRIDRTAGTVTEQWAWQPLPTLYSETLADLDVLPTGNLLVHFGTVRTEGGVTNDALNVGASRARLLEVNPETGEVLFDLELWEPGAGFEHAWYSYRAEYLAAFPP